MKATISHNLTNTELLKALTALADDSGIGEELLKAVRRKTASIDDTPKEPMHPATRHLYRAMQAEFRKAEQDIMAYAEKISLHGRL